MKCREAKKRPALQSESGPGGESVDPNYLELRFVTLRVAIITTDGLGTTELERAAHEFFAAEFGDRAAGFFNRAHGDKGEAFGTLGAVIDDDFGITDATDAIEELKEVALRGIIGKIADIEAICFDGGRIDGGVFTTRATRLAWWACGRVTLGTSWARTTAIGGWRCTALRLRKGSGLTE